MNDTRDTQTLERDQCIYQNYLEVLDELGEQANLLPKSEIYRRTAEKPLPRTFKTPEHVGRIINRMLKGNE